MKYIEKYVKVSVSLVKANIQISIEYCNIMMVDQIVTFKNMKVKKNVTNNFKNNIPKEFVDRYPV